MKIRNTFAYAVHATVALAATAAISSAQCFESNIGTPLGAGDDWVSSPQALGFNFPFAEAKKKRPDSPAVLRRTLRAAIGGGQSLMPSNHKVVALGDSIDLPLGHKDEAWSFDHIDTLTLSVGDAPRADEIVLCLGLSDGTRAHPRVGKGPSPSP